jgi:hypothetical protein
MARTAAKKAPARKAPAKAAPAKAAPAVAPGAGVRDLAGGLESLLDAVKGEVLAVTSLSTQIDGLVSDLNGVRDEQAQRLLALDALRTAVNDGGLTSFLDKLIRPRMPQVPEVVPDRLA